jgi:hypothetical protein
MTHGMEKTSISHPLHVQSNNRSIHFKANIQLKLTSDAIEGPHFIMWMRLMYFL